MNHLKKDIRLFNVIFPLWLLLLAPQAWLIVLPGNFLIDSAVLLISLLILKIGEKKQWYKQYILKIYAFGMLSDIIGSVYLLLMMTIFDVGSLRFENILTFSALILSAVLIFVFNYFVTFRKIEKELRFRLSMVFAIVTAPYTFIVPTSWLY